ncbi:hypothetical protein BO70DRAFT_287762 [Aspergillus heteromorphus CBS 117.55]|uniref:Uncharacterized protein n=1 Tax=Aspergillus heteromorphus CBS 117.55 TaxID=1448321 RepID=A0A317WME5_9EURO|nr:uncharacterized protein BO70DRAFT_287762 [Aspergillus heteromorphus CBS 117.55]PWY87539.1 hypothetical protein BO70DRAFT_287762 [Aspergillus heteromorphus CBS 117.55]
MLDTTSPLHEFPSWASMGASEHPALSAESVSLDEELYTSQLGLNGFDFSFAQLVSPALCPEFDVATGETTPLGLYDALQPMDVADAPCAPGFAEKVTSLFGESSFNIAPEPKRVSGGDLSLHDLLRSTSQLATERALYMTSLPGTGTGSGTGSTSSHDSHHLTHSRSAAARLRFAPSPITEDPCSSPGTSHQSYSGSESDWEREYSNTNYGDPGPFYGLSEIGFSDSIASLDHTLDEVIHHQQQHQPLDTPLSNSHPEPRRKSVVGHMNLPNYQPLDTTTLAADDDDDEEENGLTPLEMPDGSTRFTTNWLPVDPEGGFTIRAPPSPRPRRVVRVRHNHNPPTLTHAWGSDHTDPYYFPQDAFIALPTD